MSENLLRDPRDHIDTLAMSLALDGLLDPKERHIFDQHMLSCAGCAAQWFTWQRLDSLLRSEPLVGPAPDFVVRFNRKLIERQERRERWLGGLVLIGGTVSIWALLALGTALLMAGWLWLDPAARLQALELVGFGGQLLAVVLNTLVAWRAGAVIGIPTPLLVGLSGALLMAMALLWLRLIPPSQAHALPGPAPSGLSASFSAGDRD